MTLTIVKVAAQGPQAAGTFLVGQDGKSGYFTHAVDPGFGPMGHRDTVDVLPLVCGTDPQHVAQASYVPAMLASSASCSCGGLDVAPAKTWDKAPLAALIAHAARA